MEDEWHVIVECPEYEVQRQRTCERLLSSLGFDLGIVSIDQRQLFNWTMGVAPELSLAQRAPAFRIVRLFVEMILRIRKRAEKHRSLTELQLLAGHSAICDVHHSVLQAAGIAQQAKY